MFHRIIGLLVCVGILSLLSQKHPESQVDFDPPVRGQMQLTGTFGELRGNHFHAGLDIRGAIGRPVYAIADGFISKITIQAAGYGQALYIDHPSGHTSLYAHLNKLPTVFADFVKEQQYQSESFAQNIDLSADKFPVKKGELIGYIGKKGYAFGPHLHFEIRDTETQNPLNPMGFGITVTDTRKPFFNSIRVYDLDERGNVKSAETISTRHRGNGRYGLAKDTVWVNSAEVGLAVKVYDQQNNLNNWNGTYAIALKEQDSSLFHYQFDYFSFEQTRYINAHTDYVEQRLENSWFHRLFKLPGNQLEIYQPENSTGRILLEKGEAKNLVISTTDHAGNEAFVNIILKRRTDVDELPNKSYTYYLPSDEESFIQNDNLHLHFPEDCFYEDLYLSYNRATEPSAQIYSPVHQFGDAQIPVHRYFDLQLKPHTAEADFVQSKAIISYCEDGKEPVSYGGEWTEEGMLRAPVRAMGNFCIMMDQEAPTIETNRWANDMRGWDNFSFTIKDNFPAKGKARDLRFRAEVDGQWILMEYDYKNDLLFHVFDNKISRGEHTLVLRVKDDRDNETVFEKSFLR